MPTLETIHVDELAMEPESAETAISTTHNDTPPRPSDNNTTNAPASKSDPSSKSNASSGRKVTPGHSLRKSPTRAKQQQSARSQVSIASFFNKTSAALSSPKAAAKRPGTHREGPHKTLRASNPTATSSNPDSKSTASSNTPNKPAAKPLAKHKRMTPKKTPPNADTLLEDERRQRQMLAEIVMGSRSTSSATMPTAIDLTTTCAEADTESNPAVVEEPLVTVDQESASSQGDGINVAAVDAVQEDEPKSESACGEGKEEVFVQEEVTAGTSMDQVKATTSLEQDDVAEEKVQPQPPATKQASASAIDVDVDLSQDKDTPPAQPQPISDENKLTLENYSSLRSKYTRRVAELMERGRQGLEEENFAELNSPAKAATSVDVGSTEDFPDEALPSLLILVQESHLPLSELCATALTQLESIFPSGKFSSESVASKIKIVATRESYIAHPEVALGEQQTNAAVNVFEDTSADRMWRWEVTSLELLPEAVIPLVKKARAARRKIRAHFRALCKLLGSLHDADKLLRDATTATNKLDTVTAKISNEEEKVLKYEREEEKLRLAEEARKMKEVVKKQKELEKQKERELKQREKEEALEQKKKLQEQKKKEAQEKKLEAQRKKEEESQKKADKAAKEQQENEEALNKQRSTLMKFFASGKSTTPPKKNPEPVNSLEVVAASTVVETDRIWSKVNAGDRDSASPLFGSLSDLAVASRKRRSRHVPVLVYVTVSTDENPFNAPAYAEPQTVYVSNKYRFLSFVEDCRPAYHGTWSKKSTVVTGAKPFNQDTEFLDYEVDSEAEWEEGDDEIGEDLENDADDDDDGEEEARDSRAYDFQDGWMAADDDLGDEGEELDDETKALRKRKMQSSDADGEKQPVVEQVAIRVVAPMVGGVPFSDSQAEGVGCIDGVDGMQAQDMLSAHRAHTLESEVLCVDAFPPALVEENAAPPQKTDSGNNGQEMSRDNLKVIVEFVHHCTFPSKDRIVEELRVTHKNVTSSRAQATRKLDSIAVKRRNPVGGVIWDVKREILENLEMDELLKMQLPEEPKKIVAKKKSPSESVSATKKTTPKTDATKPSNRSSSSKKNQSGLKRKKESSVATKKKTQKLDPVKANSQSGLKRKTGSSSAAEKTAPKSDTDKTNNRSSSSKTSQSGLKRKSDPGVSEASVKLFAGFLQKRPKKQRDS